MSFKPSDSRAIDEFCQQIIKITNCTRPDVYKFLSELTDTQLIIPKNDSQSQPV